MKSELKKEENLDDDEKKDHYSEKNKTKVLASCSNENRIYMLYILSFGIQLS